MDLEEFIKDWNNDSDKLLVHTSGSTCKPKPMWVEKSRMAHSARTTCRFLGLKKGDTALLCMSLDYIAGKMMAVRAIEWGLNLICVEPSGHPLSTFNVERLTINETSSSETINEASSSETINETGSSEPPTRGRQERALFSAMTPMQVYNSLQVPEERERLMQITHLIIGGGAIDEALESELNAFPNNVWSTYGMTETLSHIALRRISNSEGVEELGGEGDSLRSEGDFLRSEGVGECRSEDNSLSTNNLSTCQLVNSSTNTNNSSTCQLVNLSTNTNNVPAEKWYTPFPDVSVSLSDDGCLVIDAPGVCAEPLVTNDCAIIHDDGRRFRIIGRKDNVINSGGIKIQAEEVEQMLRHHLPMPFIISKASDPKFGEIVVLVYEHPETTFDVEQACRSVLPKYWQPRRYLPVAQILLTETGKPRRDVSLYKK